MFRASSRSAQPAKVTEAANALDLLGIAARQEHRLPLPDADEPRFAMLSMIREYALARLGQADEHDGAMARLARYHLELAGAAGDGLRSPEKRAWTRRLDFETGQHPGDDRLARRAGPDRRRRRAVPRALALLVPGRTGRRARTWLRCALMDEELSPADRAGRWRWTGCSRSSRATMGQHSRTLAAARPLLLASEDRFALALSGGVTG